ncbi:MAG: sigma-70 family RNA polymerase sigma factor [Chthoniobacteraceae bacterium]
MKTDPAAFAPTRWTRVIEARGDAPEARAALSDLCAAYYAPVVAFLRRERSDEDAARELAQEFFARLLAGGGVDGADRERGKFRSFLLGAVKHFLADMRDHSLREKRGAGVTHESLDAGTDSAPGLEIADAHALPPDVLFDRQWALTVLDRAFTALEAELSAEGKSAHLEVLRPWLVADADRGAQTAAAAQLGVSETAVRVIIHRLRHRYREAVRAELRQTLAPGGSVEEELRQLFLALAA